MCRSGSGWLVSLVSFLFVLKFGSSNVFFKCCGEGFALDDDFNCQRVPDNVREESLMLGNDSQGVLEKCPDKANDTELSCMGFLMNGTVVTSICDKMLSNQTYEHCDSPFKLLSFWGASMVTSATMIYTLPYLLVVIVYCTYADLRKRAYDKSLICYNSSYAILNLMLIVLGFFELCHRQLPDFVYGICGSVVVYFIQASCMWLFILCFDMTLVITRFRWAPSSDSKARSERRKFKVYSLLNWGLSVIPAVVVVITEFTPTLPKDSPVRPNFSNFHGPPNKSLLIYTLALPVITLLTNTVLFVYTSYRMLKVKKDNRILNQSSMRNAKKEYFVYLKLYIIMDAPWLSGALSAIYPSLWILKFFRVIQPILMLYIILPKKRILKTIGCMKTRPENEVEDRRGDGHTKNKKKDVQPLNDHHEC
ncbi:G-protein coupled receptor Mth2-like isoform X2 [Diachasmimorpha longicaudata]|uniref:G-protein coupled receptor Mth2-like isoform X2 n=1 Tax=Diachasmimorpha longicaudata TaxID=58733 RepID=UPI0030B8E303